MSQLADGDTGILRARVHVRACVCVCGKGKSHDLAEQHGGKRLPQRQGRSRAERSASFRCQTATSTAATAVVMERSGFEAADVHQQRATVQKLPCQELRHPAEARPTCSTAAGSRTRKDSFFPYILFFLLLTLFCI